MSPLSPNPALALAIHLVRRLALRFHCPRRGEAKLPIPEPANRKCDRKCAESSRRGAGKWAGRVCHRSNARTHQRTGAAAGVQERSSTLEGFGEGRWQRAIGELSHRATTAATTALCKVHTASRPVHLRSSLYPAITTWSSLPPVVVGDITSSNSHAFKRRG